MTSSLKKIKDTSIDAVMKMSLTEQRAFLSGILITPLKDPTLKDLLKKFLVMNVLAEIRSSVEEKSIFNITHHVSRLFAAQMKLNKNTVLKAWGTNCADLKEIFCYPNYDVGIEIHSKSFIVFNAIDDPNQLRQAYKNIHESTKYYTLGFVLMRASFEAFLDNVDNSQYRPEYGYKFGLKPMGWIALGIFILALIPCTVLTVLEHMLFMAIKPLEMLYHKLFGNSYDAFIQKYIDAPDPDDAELLKNVNVLKQASRDEKPTNKLNVLPKEVLSNIVLFSCKTEATQAATIGLFSSPKRVVDSNDLKEKMEEVPLNSATSP